MLSWRFLLKPECPFKGKTYKTVLSQNFLRHNKNLGLDPDPAWIRICESGSKTLATAVFSGNNEKEKQGARFVTVKIKRDKEN
jgi:hypothetical protein